MLQNPCEFKLSTSPVISAKPYDSSVQAQIAAATPTTWVANQNIQNYILTNNQTLPQNGCPPERPYLQGFMCINCGGDTPYFDVASQRCVNCGVGTYFSERNHTCLKISVMIPGPCSGGRY